MKADHDTHKTEKRAPPSGKPKTSRLRFSKEESTAPVQAGANAAVMTGAAVIHEQFKADEEENPAVEALDRTGLTSAGAVRLVHTHAQRGQDVSEKSRRISHEEEQRGRMHFEGSGDSPQASAKDSTREKQKKEAVRHQQKKKQVRDGYKASQKRRQQAENAGSALESVMNQLKDAVVEKKHAILIILGLLFMALFLMTQLASCGTMITGAVDAFLETTWLSDDEDFNRADLYYTRLEAELARKVGRSSVLHPGYDEYRFTLDEIGHNPSELVSYLSAEAENSIFEYNAELEDKLDALFAQQYSLLYADRTETTTTSKTVRVGGSIGQVVTSAYCNCAICCGPWAGSPTASGVWPTGNHTLAVDAYAPIVPMGTQIIMNGTLYKVEDTGNLNRYGVNFDVYMDSHATAQLWGHKTFEAFLYDANGRDTVTVTETSTKKICAVTLKRKSIDELARRNLNLIQQEQYSLYKESGGNRPFLAPPVDGDWKNSVISYYGYRCNEANAVVEHQDLMISRPAGTRVYAPFDGVVTEIGSNSTLGTFIKMQKDDYTVTYAHLSSVSVANGQTFTKGSMIGRVGSTGNVREPTLAITFQYQGTCYNPWFYLQSEVG